MSGFKQCARCNQDRSLHLFLFRKDRNSHGSYCNSCRSEMDCEYRTTNPERFRASEIKRRINKKDELAKRNKEYRIKNSIKLAAYYKANAARRMASTKEWRKLNSGRWTATVAKRNAAKKQRTPIWANQDSILSFYKTAQSLSMLLGEWYEVDHIIPLQSPAVSGLHCEYNLQVISKKQNQSKGNRYWPDMPCLN